MKYIIIRLKKDYLYDYNDKRIGTYTFTKSNNTICIEKIKKITFKNNYLKITYKSDYINSYITEKNIPLEAIESYETY